MHISWVRLASFCQLGFISYPIRVLKFHNETYDPKGQENKIYTIVKGRETFYRRHTVPVTSCSEVKYVLKRVSFGSKDCTMQQNLVISGLGPFISHRLTADFFITINFFVKIPQHARIQEFSSAGVQVRLTKKSSDNGFFF